MCEPRVIYIYNAGALAHEACAAGTFMPGSAKFPVGKLPEEQLRLLKSRESLSDTLPYGGNPAPAATPAPAAAATGESKEVQNTQLDESQEPQTGVVPPASPKKNVEEISSPCESKPTPAASPPASSASLSPPLLPSPLNLIPSPPPQPPAPPAPTSTGLQCSSPASKAFATPPPKARAPSPSAEKDVVVSKTDKYKDGTYWKTLV